jgi:hypothetical protein
MKLVKLIKTCVKENYSRIRVSKHLSDVFTIRNGLKYDDVLYTLLFNFTFEYAIRKFQVNQDGLKLNGTHQFWFMLMMLYWAKAYVLQKTTEDLLDGSKEIGLEVNAD